MCLVHCSQYVVRVLKIIIVRAGCFNLFCNVWARVFVGLVMCGCFGNMYNSV